MNRLRLILICAFLAGSIIVTVAYNLHKPRVLVLHSYDLSYPWTREVSVGVRRVLDEHSHFAVRWFYMDTKRHPEKEFKQKMGLSARQSIDRWNPDVIIAVDDDAQEFVTRHYVDHPRIKIVFAGVNGGVESYGFVGAGNVTGIFERKDFPALKEALLALRWPRTATGPLRVMHIGDTSSSVGHDDQHMREFDWKPLINLPSRRAGTFDDWKKAVIDAQDKTDFIITTNYRRINRSATDKVLVPPEEVVAWTVANSRVPLVGSNGFFVEDGGELAIGTSPFEQGEVAARMAIKLLGGQVAKDIPHATTRQFVVYMRSARLHQRGMQLPALYEAFARATNNDLP
jgi:ABC-type uncharacterized transport system substrate-binding protein